jgi:hypothetical protein
MTTEDCKNCPSHIELLSDSILCKHNGEVTHRVLSQGRVVGCPIAVEKKGFFSFLKN